LTHLNLSVLQIKIKIVCCHTADSKPVKQEVNGTVIFPTLVFPVLGNIIEQAASNKSSLLLRMQIDNTQTLQLFTMIIKTESILKSY